LRREEILSLKLEDIDFNKRLITPNNHEGETKKSWVSFYSEEAETALKEYLANKEKSRSRNCSQCNEMKWLSFGNLLEKRLALTSLHGNCANGSVLKC
jgi:integrase